MERRLHIVVLAAGKGKRMRSDLPKVLQPLAGQPLLAHVLNVARELDPEQLHVVIGHGSEEVRQTFSDCAEIHWVLQAEQLGTGHAVQMALPVIPEEARVLILMGDAPLVLAETLRQVIDQGQDGFGILSAVVPEATNEWKPLAAPQAMMMNTNG